MHGGDGADGNPDADVGKAGRGVLDEDQWALLRVWRGEQANVAAEAVQQVLGFRRSNELGRFGRFDRCLRCLCVELASLGQLGQLGASPAFGLRLGHGAVPFALGVPIVGGLLEKSLERSLEKSTGKGGGGRFTFSEGSTRSRHMSSSAPNVRCCSRPDIFVFLT